jgi:hypothetical protein
MQPTTHQKMAKTIPNTKPTRKPKNNTKHQRGDEKCLELTGPGGERKCLFGHGLTIKEKNFKS